jgi:hypothetical protein
MKTFGTLANTIALTVQDTEGGDREFTFPAENVHYWYPFNVNFVYQYTVARNFLYLVQDPASRELGVENIYEVDLLKRTKPLEQKDGTMFHPKVYERNMEIIQDAKMLGIPTIDEPFDKESIQEGFSILDDMINAALEFEAEQALLYYGEMYSMLTLMRKIDEGR